MDWFAWGEQAFETARRDDKPIFLSVGYSTCYWCHVMEHDSFETTEVAEVLNRNFVSIKVDREERPDVDRLYMDAVVAFSGRGGWPMTVFLTPDLKPFFGATFFWRAQFVSLVDQIAEHWRTNRQAILDSADEVLKFLEREEDRRGNAPGEELLIAAFRQLEATFDAPFGGFGGAPKFPPAEKIRLLLRLHRRSGSPAALQPAFDTLMQMMRGGLFDQIGGGFHRYSTDERWLVPHFEKMLYDNALLATAYIEAFQAMGNADFAHAARLTLEYVLEALRGPEGEIFSAEDAGEVGREGEFYLWSYEELKTALNEEEFAALSEVFDLSKGGNFEGQIILAYQPNVPFEARERPAVKQALNKLKALRSKRERPRLDDKALTAWMSLAASALLKGWSALNDARYLQAAESCVNFIENVMLKDGELLRRYRDNEAALPGYLDDYAFYIQAVIDLYQATGKPSFLQLAQQLQGKQDVRFWDSDGGGYFYSRPDDPEILVQKKEFQDAAEPSGNGVSALNLLRLSALTGLQAYRERAEKLFAAVTESVDRYPSGFASLLIALDFYLDRAKEVALIGKPQQKERLALEEVLRTSFLPNVVYLCADEEECGRPDAPALIRGKRSAGGRATAYICEHGLCGEPLSERERIRAALAEFKPLALG